MPARNKNLIAARIDGADHPPQQCLRHGILRNAIAPDRVGPQIKRPDIDGNTTLPLQIQCRIRNGERARLRHERAVEIAFQRIDHALPAHHVRGVIADFPELAVAIALDKRIAVDLHTLPILAPVPLVLIPVEDIALGI